jgi:NodT family efflux transporter outer membrane factor (OMF) lipoprotein
MRCVRDSLLALALLMGASCSTVPATVKPPVSPPARFTVSGQTPLPDRWWRSFRDPALEELVDRALAENLTLRSAWDRLAQAEAVARKAGAALWPAMDGAAGAARVLERNAAVGDTTYRTALSLGLVAGYELDLWGRIRSTRDAAALDARATQDQLRAAALTLSARVAATWYELVEQHGQIRLLDEQIRTNEEILELVTLRFRRGLSRAADVLQQRQLVEARRGDRVAAESRAAVLAHQLAILLGRPPAESVAEPVPRLPTLPPLPDTGLPVELIQRRPDIREAFHEVLAADRRAAAAVAERFPRVSLAANVNTTGPAVRDLFDNWMATMAANLVAPLFDAGARRAEVDRARAVVSERLNGYGQRILDALVEVEDALVQERKQEELIGSLARQLEISGQVIERTRDSYLAGTVDYLRVLDALLTHQVLQRQHLQAQRQQLEFRINLCRALGGGWEMPRPNPQGTSLEGESPATPRGGGGSDGAGLAGVRPSIDSAVDSLLIGKVRR